MEAAPIIMVKPALHYLTLVKNFILKKEEVQTKMLTHAIYDYAKEHDIPMEDGETYGLFMRGLLKAILNYIPVMS